MAEIYRARDAKLNRDVAIKILPAAFGCLLVADEILASLGAAGSPRLNKARDTPG